MPAGQEAPPGIHLETVKISSKITHGTRRMPDGDHTRVAPPGWTTLEGRFGTFNPTATTYPLGVPDGVNVTHSNGGTMYQVLAAVLEPNTIYTLRVELGNRPETPFPGYMVQLLAAGSVLAEDVGAVAPPSETFATSQVTFQAAIADAISLLEDRIMTLPYRQLACALALVASLLGSSAAQAQDQRPTHRPQSRQPLVAEVLGGVNAPVRLHNGCPGVGVDWLKPEGCAILRVFVIRHLRPPLEN